MNVPSPRDAGGGNSSAKRAAGVTEQQQGGNDDIYARRQSKRLRQDDSDTSKIAEVSANANSNVFVSAPGQSGQKENICQQTTCTTATNGANRGSNTVAQPVAASPNETRHVDHNGENNVKESAVFDLFGTTSSLNRVGANGETTQIRNSRKNGNRNALAPLPSHNDIALSANSKHFSDTATQISQPGHESHNGATADRQPASAAVDPNCSTDLSRSLVDLSSSSSAPSGPAVQTQSHTLFTYEEGDVYEEDSGPSIESNGGADVPTSLPDIPTREEDPVASRAMAAMLLQLTQMYAQTVEKNLASSTTKDIAMTAQANAMTAQANAMAAQANAMAEQSKAMAEQSKAMAAQANAMAEQSKAMAALGAENTKQLEIFSHTVCLLSRQPKGQSTFNQHQEASHASNQSTPHPQPGNSSLFGSLTTARCNDGNMMSSPSARFAPSHPETPRTAQSPSLAPTSSQQHWQQQGGHSTSFTSRTNNQEPTHAFSFPPEQPQQPHRHQRRDALIWHETQQRRLEPISSSSPFLAPRHSKPFSLAPEQQRQQPQPRQQNHDHQMVLQFQERRLPLMQHRHFQQPQQQWQRHPLQLQQQQQPHGGHSPLVAAPTDTSVTKGSAPSQPGDGASVATAQTGGGDQLLAAPQPGSHANMDCN